VRLLVGEIILGNFMFDTKERIVREKIEFCIRFVILVITASLIVTDKSPLWPGLAMAADPWRSMIIKRIKDNPSDGIIYVLIVETFITAVLYFKILMEIVV
jgi:hypothetical protein